NLAATYEFFDTNLASFPQGNTIGMASKIRHQRDIALCSIHSLCRLYDCGRKNEWGSLGCALLDYCIVCFGQCRCQKLCTRKPTKATLLLYASITFGRNLVEDAVQYPLAFSYQLTFLRRI